MRLEKTLGIGSVVLLLISMAMVVGATPWDGVVDDPTPAQAIWVDPGFILGIPIDDAFTVDVMVNVTDPDPLNSPPDGLFGFDYHFKWDATIIDLTSYTINIPPEWTNYFIVADTVGDYNSTHKYHWVGASALFPSAYFAGVTSLCTYNFNVTDLGSCALDLQDTKLADDMADPIPHTTYDGYFSNLPVILATAVYFDLNPNPANPGQLVTLLGNLTESDSGKPMANTQVDLYVGVTLYTSLWTNGSGWFKASGKLAAPGNYLLNVTYPGNATHSPSSHVEILVVREPTATWTYFNFVPNPASPATSVTLKGILVDDSSNPLSNTAVTVEYSVNDGATWNYIWTLTTNGNGMFSRTFSAPGAGRYLVRVSYEGNSTHPSSSNNAYLIVLPPTYGGEAAAADSIFFNLIPNPATSGTSVTLRGILLDEFGQPIPSAAVTVEYSVNDGATWNYIWTLTTNQYGIFSKTFKAPADGTYLLRVTYVSISITTYLVVQP